MTHDVESMTPPAPYRLRAWQRLGIFMVLVAAVAGLYTVGNGPRLHQNAVLAAASKEQQSRLPRVRVVNPKQAASEIELKLPGDIEPIEQTVIYPRVTGYLKKWYVDIGDTVKKGQLLAEIDTPEIDQQYKQALAKVDQLKARLLVSETKLKLSRITLDRIQRLISSNASSQQEFEQREAEFGVAQHEVQVAHADIAAGEAELQRISEMQSFAKIYAPFDGIITQRSIELGQLVTSGNDQAQSLFRLVRSDKVKVIVYVPQIYASSICKDQKADLIVREMPNKKIEGIVRRTAASLDSQTRTMRTEIEVENPEGLLLPGTYVQAVLHANRQQAPLIIPASALIVNADGTQVAIIDPQRKVTLQQVDVEGDYGTTLGIISGVQKSDEIVVNPGDRLKNEMTVEIVAE